jgi:hypothetical protein
VKLDIKNPNPPSKWIKMTSNPLFSAATMSDSLKNVVIIFLANSNKAAEEDAVSLKEKREEVSMSF